MLTAIMTGVSGCSGGNNAAAPEATPAAEATQAPAEATPAPTEAPAATPAADLNGREIRISHWWDATPAGDSEADELARERIKAVEEKYNVKIKYLNTEYWSTAEKLSSSVMANDPLPRLYGCRTASSGG